MHRLTEFFTIFSARTWWQLGVAFGLFLLPMIGFVQLADEVFEQDTLGFDEGVLRAVNSFSAPWLDSVVIALTQFGGLLGVIVITSGLVMLLWGRQKKARAVLLALGVGGAAVLNLVLKSIFQRDRPQLWERLVTENSYSFPSGHAMASSALALSLIVIFWPTKWRWLMTGLAGCYMLVIGFTRLYLGVHYPTDVLAGWLVSGAWIALMMAVFRYRHRIGRFFSSTPEHSA